MFVIGLGYEGPTDACLTLSFNGVTKEYLIEGNGWQMLEAILRMRPQQYGALPYTVPSRSISWWACHGIWESDHDSDLREDI